MDVTEDNDLEYADLADTVRLHYISVVSAYRNLLTLLVPNPDEDPLTAKSDLQQVLQHFDVVCIDMETIIAALAVQGLSVATFLPVDQAELVHVMLNDEIPVALASDLIAYYRQMI